jgi:mono/diheme cytochrome c family protein
VIAPRIVGAAMMIAVCPWADVAAGAEGKAKDASIPPAAAKEGREIFDTRCSVCHGKEGKGDGPGAAGLNPKPRDLSDSAWQKSVDDTYIEKIIQYGGIAVGKSAMMPGNPDLNAKPDVVKGIRAVVRELGHHK